MRTTTLLASLFFATAPLAAFAVSGCDASPTEDAGLTGQGLSLPSHICPEITVICPSTELRTCTVVGGCSVCTCTTPPTSACTSSGKGAITFTTSGGGLSLTATSAPGTTAGSMTTSWSITRGATSVLAGSTTTTAAGARTTQTTYGAGGFTGLTQSTMSFDGKTLTGSVNGRALVPETLGFGAPDGGYPAFADKKPQPTVVVDPELQGEMSTLLGHLRSDALSLCPASASPEIASLINVLGAASAGATSATSSGGAAGNSAAMRTRTPLGRPPVAPPPRPPRTP